MPWQPGQLWLDDTIPDDDDLNQEGRDRLALLRAHSHDGDTSTDTLGPVRLVALQDAAADPDTEGDLRRNGAATRYLGPDGLAELSPFGPPNLPGPRSIGPGARSIAPTDHIHTVGFFSLDETFVADSGASFVVVDFAAGPFESTPAALNLTEESVVVVTAFGLVDDDFSDHTLIIREDGTEIGSTTAQIPLGANLTLMALQVIRPGVAAGAHEWTARVEMSQAEEFSGCAVRAQAFGKLPGAP